MKFLDLPVEVIMRVIDRSLDPLDILSLGQTCWALHKLCDDEPVWKRALTRMRLQNHVFPAVLHPEDTSLSSLKREAVAPALFTSLVKHAATSAGAEISPTARYKMRGFDDGDAGSDAHTDSLCICHTSLCLLPGGKILVLNSSNSIYIVEIDVSSGVLSLEMLYAWEEHCIDQIIAVESGPNDNVRIAVSISSSGASRVGQFAVLEYNLATDAAQMKYRPGVPFEAGKGMTGMCGDSLFYTVEGSLCRWNFVTDHVCALPIAEDDYEELILPPESDLVILISRSRVYGYIFEEESFTFTSPTSQGTDPLTASPPAFTMPIPDLPQDMSLLCHAKNYRLKRHAVLAHSCPPPPSLALDFCAFSAMRGFTPNTAMSSLYRIHLPNSEDATGRVETLYAGESECSFGHDVQVLPTRRAHGALFETWLYEQVPFLEDDGPERMVIAFRDPTWSENPKDLNFVDIALDMGKDEQSSEHRVVDVFDFSLDPVSGRLCYLNTNEPNVIGVIDYLPV